MLNTFFHRSCSDYSAYNPLATCQTSLDLVLMLAAGLGAGLVLSDERVGLVGFLASNLLGIVIFVSFLQIPVFLGLGDPVIADTMLGRSLVLALGYEFPFSLILSFFGCVLGIFFKGRLESVQRSASL